MTAVCHYGEGTTGIVNVNEHGPFTELVSLARLRT